MSPAFFAVSNVRKRYGRMTALDGVSLAIGSGEKVAFVGSNGSGKTTLLRALIGLVRVEGRATVGGVDVAQHPELALRDVAYIPQIAPPVDVPVEDLLGTFMQLRNRGTRPVHDHAGCLGLDLGSVLRTRFRDLSGGMRQKVLAALALAVDTRAIVCDETTANLDPAARKAFFAALHERPADSIVVLCSHRAEEVAGLVGRVVELADGKIVSDGPFRASTDLDVA
jgi:ABC-2 type transport system ATP-binding protein